MPFKYHCRAEKTLTDHVIVKVTDNLPSYMHVVECQSCGVLGMGLFEEDRTYCAEL